MTNLPAESFAAMVYWLFVMGICMILAYFLELVYRVNKRWVALIIVCPPLCLLFIWRNWDTTKAAFFFFLGFYLVILFAGSLTGYDMNKYTLDLLQLIFSWPIYATKLIAEQHYIQKLIANLS